MSNVKLFDNKKIRSQWDAKQEKWFFSIVDIIEVLTGTERPRKYWSDLKSKLKAEGSELS
jgi:protein tyrosine/serine phosphatase